MPKQRCWETAGGIKSTW